MVKSLTTSFILFYFFCSPMAQEAKYPIVADFGGIYEIPEATVKPYHDQVYRIVIDVVSGPSSPDKLNPALNNVARMLNLHGLGGVKAENLNVVLAIHGQATESVINNEAYQRLFQVDNPNLPLIDALDRAGVRMTVCGQSLLGKNIATSVVNSKIEIALSMLTTVTTYQLMGYGLLRF